jgi:hypothetical protein
MLHACAETWPLHTARSTLCLHNTGCCPDNTGMRVKPQVAAALACPALPLGNTSVQSIACSLHAEAYAIMWAHCLWFDRLSVCLCWQVGPDQR